MRDTPWLQRRIHQGGLLLARRGRLMLACLGALLGVVFLGILFAPQRHVARALVAPAAWPYQGSAGSVLAMTDSPAVYREVARRAGVPEEPTLVERILGRAELVKRLGASVAVQRDPGGGLEHFVVETAGATREQAREGAVALAELLIANDAQVRALDADVTPAARRESADPSEEGPPAAAPIAELAAELEAARARHPDLGEPGLAEEVENLSYQLTRDAVALDALQARTDATAERARRLEGRVYQEARRAYAAARQEEEAARRQAAAGPERAERAEGAAEEASRVAELEAELRRLLTTRTRRHPDVRRLVRELDAERAHEEALGRAPRARPPAAEPDDTEEVVDRTVDLTVPIAADEAELGAGEGVPDVWLQRAPSYESWLAARRAEEAARVELEVLEREVASRRAALAELEDRLTIRREAEREAARLERLLEEARERQARAEAAARARREARSGGDSQPRLPLELQGDVAIQVVRSAPWHVSTGVPVALLLALLLGCVVDLYDRSFHQADELAEYLDVPVLGVVPHLRGR